MPAFRRGANVHPQHRSKAGRVQLSMVFLLLSTMIFPLVFLSFRINSFRSSDWASAKTVQNQMHSRKSVSLKPAEAFFPKEVLDIILAHSEHAEKLDQTKLFRGDTSASLVQEDHSKVRYKNGRDLEAEANPLGQRLSSVIQEEPKVTADDDTMVESEDEVAGENLNTLNLQELDPLESAGKEEDEEEKSRLEDEAIERSKEIEGSILGKYSIWKNDESEESDGLVRLIRDQLIMARVYLTLPHTRNDPRLMRDLKLRIRDSQNALGEATLDVNLPKSAPERVRAMGQALARARAQNIDCGIIVRRLRAMLHSTEGYTRTLKKQSTYLSQLAAKTMPKSLHCLALRLTVEYHGIPVSERDMKNAGRLEDPSLYHYALFSDNILAASVVVNSTVINALEPEKHVFHLVTDRLNYGAMKMWFLANPPGNATIYVESVANFKWLNSSYCPVLRQLRTANTRDFYFKQDGNSGSNMKYRNPKYLSMLNHLRFYLPQVYPKLDKILFLDDDIVVQKDLSPLWKIDLEGKVNGAVETCGNSFHRFDKYLNFSNSHIARNFDPHACGWAFGMNIFDLKAWREKDITGIYHKWQNLNEDRVLWKLGTLPPGLITFYNLTYALDKNWHVLGLGYNPTISRSEIDRAAVIHYNGNLKPWLEIGLSKYRRYWGKYVKYDHSFLQQCNINR